MACKCEQHAQSCYFVADWPGVKLATFQSGIQRPNYSATELPAAEQVNNNNDNKFRSLFFTDLPVKLIPPVLL